MNYRIFVEKKEDFRVEAQNLFSDLKENIGIDGLTSVRVLNIYDIFNLGENDLEKLEKTVFSEINVDNVFKSFDEVFKEKNSEKCVFLSEIFTRAI